MTTPSRSPVVAGGLSLLFPGLGQLYNGEPAKGWAMVCIAAGLGLTCVISRSVVTAVLVGVVYLIVLIPTVADAYQTARGRPTPFHGETVWYVIVMLLTVGPFALPLLWQSPRFSRPAKIGWTLAILLIALSFLAILAVLGPMIERAVPLRGLG